MYRVEGRENKKAEKSEKEQSKEKKSERFQEKKKKKNKSKFWLMPMRQSEILYIFTWRPHKNLTIVWEKNVNAKKNQFNGKKRVFLLISAY